MSRRASSLKVIEPPPAPVAPKPERILRLPEVLSRVGLSRQTIWRLTRAGQFPASVRLTANAIGWRQSDVEQWMADRGTR